jgi:tetratricopeptide (TPR) repeat protein
MTAPPADLLHAGGTLPGSARADGTDFSRGAAPSQPGDTCSGNRPTTGREQPPEGGTRNALSGSADNVVQARDIQGGVHVHQPRASSLPAPRQLPANVTFFTGRDAELGTVDALLDRGGPAAVVISAIAGTGGMGKTSLAVHWAHRVRGRFPDGELYVNLRGYDPGPPVTPDQALDGFLRALDVPAEKIPHDVDAQAGLYRSLLAGRRMVVVLDNAAAPDQVRPLLPGSPTCVVVVTSRSQLSGLVARDGARRLTLDVLPPEDAVTLLRCAVGPDRVETRRDRYQFHDLLRAYATERAALDESPDEYATATHRVLAWYLHTAHAALYALYPQHPEIPLDPLTVTCQPLTSTHRDQALQWCDAEHANLMAAIQLAADAGQYTIAWQLPNTMDTFLALRYHWADRITVHQLGLAAAEHIHDQRGERWALGHLGKAYLELSRFDEALPLFLRGLSVARKNGNRWDEGNSLRALGDVHLHFGQFDEAADHYQQALVAYREVNHQRNEGVALRNLAGLARARQHFEQAITPR